MIQLQTERILILIQERTRVWKKKKEKIINQKLVLAKRVS